MRSPSSSSGDSCGAGPVFGTPERRTRHPMTDIVEWLRNALDRLNEAAAEIERLRIENAALRRALEIKP